MEVVKWATVAVLASLATPASAVTCMEAVPAINKMINDGYKVKKLGESEEWAFYLAISPGGKWVKFVLNGGVFCFIQSGLSA